LNNYSQQIIDKLLDCRGITPEVLAMAKNCTEDPYLEEILWVAGNRDQFNWIIGSGEYGLIQLGYGEMEAFILSTRKEYSFKNSAINFLKALAGEAARRASPKSDLNNGSCDINVFNERKRLVRLRDALEKSILDAPIATQKSYSEQTLKDHERYYAAARKTPSKQCVAPGMTPSEIKIAVKRRRARKAGQNHSISKWHVFSVLLTMLILVSGPISSSKFIVNLADNLSNALRPQK